MHKQTTQMLQPQMLFQKNITSKCQSKPNSTNQFYKSNLISKILNSRTKKRYHALKFHTSNVDMASWSKVS